MSIICTTHTHADHVNVWCSVYVCPKGTCIDSGIPHNLILGFSLSLQSDDDMAALELDEAELGVEEETMFQSRKKIKEDRPGTT